MSGEIVRHDGGGTAIEREGLGGSRELERRNETASTAVSAQARAEIEAAYIVARANPRDDDNVRARLLKSCRKSSFAAKAFYSIPRGDKPGRLTGAPNRIEGLTVRFAEAVIRDSGNIRQQTRTLYDDDVKRIVQVSCIDLETNAQYSRDIVVEKTIERKKPKDGQVVLSKRENSAGDVVYLIQASDDELLMKESNLVARTFRTLALRLLPADTLQDCETEIVKTTRAEISADPDAAKRAILDSFLNLNIKPSDLKVYLGHAVEQCSPAELELLRGLYGAIRDGDVTWAEVLTEKTGTTEGGGDAAAANAGERKSAGATVAERVKKRVEDQARKNAKPAAAGDGAPAPAKDPAAEPKPEPTKS